MDDLLRTAKDSSEAGEVGEVDVVVGVEVEGFAAGEVLLRLWAGHADHPAPVVRQVNGAVAVIIANPELVSAGCPILALLGWGMDWLRDDTRADESLGRRGPFPTLRRKGEGRGTPRRVC